MNKSTFNYFLFTALCALFAFPLDAQQFFFSTERPSSCAATDGIITIVPTRGIPPFTYLWSTGATETSVKNVPKGVYSATLTDAAGATISHTCYLNSEETDIHLLAIYPAGGCNPLSGRITVEGMGGTAPYSYAWSNGQTTAVNQGLTAGKYTVTVTDANGCTAQNEYEVGTLPWTYFTSAYIETLNAPDCSNPNNGVLKANMYSLYPAELYQWNSGANSQAPANLSKGQYDVTITDVLGCTAVTATFLDNKLDIQSNTICSGANTGFASAQLVNGQSPVGYVWSNGQTGSQISNVNDGFYSVTATDANGCIASGSVNVFTPTLVTGTNEQMCYSGNNGVGYVWVNNDQATSILWDNGATDSWTNTLSSGAHDVTVTTALGCTLTTSVNVAPSIGAPVVILATATAADCSNNLGGSLSISVQGGSPPFSYYIYDRNGFFTNDINNLQNLQGGEYIINAFSTFHSSCYGSVTIPVPDLSGFEPKIAVGTLDCNTGYATAEILNVTNPNVQYSWSNGATTPNQALLTEGCYSVTVSAGGACNRYFDFCLYSHEDSLQSQTLCTALAQGRLINDLGAPGCTGAQGIPYQVIRTLPSGAINFTDQNGDYSVGLPLGASVLEVAQYDPADIVCPAGSQHNINAALGSITTGLDFHFLNNNGVDHSVRQRPLRSAQPGYPYSVRLEVCNEGSIVQPGVLDLEYGNFLGAVNGNFFARHPGAFTFGSESAGIPNRSASFNFPGVSIGNCEMLQLDLATPTTTSLNTSFIQSATVTPATGDPTPANNISLLHNVVMGAFDPNCVLAYPVRNGNPKDGGQILRNEDNRVVYQIFFQNTGNAPADQVVVRDLLDPNVDPATIRNITASHDMVVKMSEDQKSLIFRFDHINLPDSTSDYAGSIGSIQYEVDLKPGLQVGTLVEKQAAIYFDFNPAVITNQNVLELVNSTRLNQPLVQPETLPVFPNPTTGWFEFYCDSASVVRMYDALGRQVHTQNMDAGWQSIDAGQMAPGVYMIRLESNGKLKTGKVTVTR